MSHSANHVDVAHEAWMNVQLLQVEQALSNWVAPMAPSDSSSVVDLAPVLSQAMRYAVLDGGKRLRPLLVLAAAEAVAATDDKSTQAALRAACAVELIHAYSLVHDDMPCMDNDILRRGKPTVHVQFGEAQALLAGDALQALAFELLTPAPGIVDTAVQATLCRILALSAGCHGMAGGQAIDLASVGHTLNEQQLSEMHRLKTGALLQGSVMMGAACGTSAPAQQLALQAYGAALGLAFQVVDDILDVTADSATLGKTAGKDAIQDKPTYVALLGLQRSQAFAQALLTDALTALATADLPHPEALRALADMVVNRQS